MRYIGLLLLVGVFFLSCSSVDFDHPLPADKMSQAQQKAFEGAWLLQDEDGEEGMVIHLEFENAEQAQLASVFRERGVFEMVKGEISFSLIGEQSYLNLRMQNSKGDWEKYLIFGYTLQGTKLNLRPLEVDTLKKLVEEKQLKGKVEESSYRTQVEVVNSPEELRAVFSKKGVVSFSEEEPLVLKKLLGAGL